VSLLDDAKQTVIAAASVASRFGGELLTAAGVHFDEMLDAFSDYEAADYLQNPAAAYPLAADSADGPEASVGGGPSGPDSDIPPSPAEGHPTYEITLHRAQLILGGGGAYLGFSDEFPDKQFLIVPQNRK
jgi:hypothetical protein